MKRNAYRKTNGSIMGNKNAYCRWRMLSRKVVVTHTANVPTIGGRIKPSNPDDSLYVPVFTRSSLALTLLTQATLRE